VLLRELLEAPDLRLRVLVGQDALDRQVGGVFTTDLLDPRRYLSGGEIVLTGLMWRRGPADSDAFVAAVAAAGAVALAAGDAALGSVPEDLVLACRQHRLPLFEVPVDVSFAAITEQVLTARLRLAGPAGPGPAVARLRSVAAAPAGTAHPGPGEPAAASLAAVFAVADSEYGTPAWVISAAGQLIAGAPPPPGAELRRELAGAWLGAGDRPVTVLASGAPYSLWPLAGQSAHPLTGWFVALAGDQGGWDEGQRAIAAELAALTAGYRARHEEGQRAGRQSADNAVRRVLDWRAGAGGDEEIAAALRRCGLAPSPPLVAVALTVGPGRPARGRAPDLTELPQVARVLLEELLPAPVVAVSGAEAIALAPGGEELVSRVREAVEALGQVPWADLAFGVSVLAGGAGEPAAESYGEVAGPGTGWTAAGVARAVAQATRARRLAALPGGVRLVDAATIGSLGLLLSLLPGEARQAFRAALLDPLIAYDTEHATELLRTLEVFLRCSGSWTKAADTMFVHVNSLRYRIRRIEELTGRDLSSLEDQAALLLALRLAEDQRADPGGGAGAFLAG
jgi:purine catabolism regulatory family protein/PucR-like helix-turn-helix protein